MISPWWERLPLRIVLEDHALAKLSTGQNAIVRKHRWTTQADGEPRILVDLAVPGALVVEVRFPKHYPEACPSVRPVPYDKPISSHQFTSSGVFCLEYGPDNWHPRLTAADMVLSAWRLIVYEFFAASEPIEIPTRHNADAIERIRLGKPVLMRPASFEQRLSSAEADAEFEFVWPSRNMLRVFPVAFPPGEVLPETPPALLRESPTRGLFIKLSVGAPHDAPTDPMEFRSFIERFSHASLGESLPSLVLLQWSDGKTRGYFCWPKNVSPLIDLPYEPSPGKRMPDEISSALKQAKVGIVGMGSLGGEVAVILARTGVRRFLLVDGDVFEGPNVCRHVGGYGDVGALKVDVVKELIRDVSAAEPEVTTRAVVLGSPTNPAFHDSVLAELGVVDILIDATGSAEAFCLLAMIASDNRRPMVWGEVFGGGIGGLVASAHPDHGPCPRCVRAGLIAATCAWPPAPNTRSESPYGGGSGEPIEATAADVGVVASAISNRVIQLLSPTGDAAPAAIFIGLRRIWVFECPMDCLPITVRRDDWSCERCWVPPHDPDPEALALAQSILRG